ncbi:hypothetical protein SISNIDRAFT_392737, partial [Sistotremastrum niveocremeum HHB9708]
VPVLRFAATGVALPESPIGTTDEPVWIIEEAIPGIFFKFINNNGVTPMPGLNQVTHAIAIFLCFCQHVQYNLTSGCCLVADYQGSVEILTDAELATQEANSRHFGRGSISDILENFPTRHICNEWCDYFGI